MYTFQNSFVSQTVICQSFLLLCKVTYVREAGLQMGHEKAY